MNALQALWRNLQLDEDPLAEFRPVIVRQLSAAASVVMLLIALVHVTGGRTPLAALNFAAMLLMLGNTRRMAEGREPLLPFHWVALGLLTLICLSTWQQGLPGVLWAYALLFVCYFALPRQQATLMCLLVVGVVSSLVLWQQSGDLALRVAASLLFVVLMVNSVISVIGRLQRALQAEAITDPLTGAYNRRHLQAQLAAVGSVAAPPSGEAGAAPDGNALLALDVDHFKAINDRHGHDTGDEVLRRLVTLLNGRKRVTDGLFRTGGEEFMLLLPRTSPQAAMELAEQLRLRVASSPLLPGERVTVSIGVAVLAPGQDARHWLKAADQALYKAKRSGRNQVALAA